MVGSLLFNELLIEIRALLRWPYFWKKLLMMTSALTWVFSNNKFAHEKEYLGVSFGRCIVHDI